jgi:uncharacterized membrane protein YkvA (DUF1232 family)
MFTCPDCNQDFGTNKDCERCLEYLIRHGTEQIDQGDVEKAEAKASKWLKGRGKAAPERLFRVVMLLSELIGDYFRRRYREIPYRTLAAATFAIFYTINPFDLVPDFLPVVGWTDDITIVGLVLAGMALDLRNYCEFKGYDPADYGLAPELEYGSGSASDDPK